MLTLGAAARHTGRSKSAISRAIASGKLSAVRSGRPKGGWEIDPAELMRVYPRDSSGNRETGPNATPGETTAELVALGRLLDEREATIRDLRARLDASEAERRCAQERLTALITVERPPAQTSRRWWKRLLG